MKNAGMKEANVMQQNEELEAVVVQALERPPVVRIADGFAARVAAAAAAMPVEPVRVRRRVSAGRVMAMVALGVLGVTLFVLAPQAGTRVASWPFVVEMLALVQMAGIGYGLIRLDRG